jgi:SAM-dependent methyltransferase
MVKQDGVVAPRSAVDRERVRARWTANAVAWARWADSLAEIADKLNQPLLDAADIGPGQAVLDLASGVGEPALGAARRVGATGSVTATDLVPEMLGTARRRAARGGLGNLRYLVADMQRLPFAGARFDRVACRFGLMFCADPERALAEARRVLKPGGRAAFMAWGPIEDTALFKVIRGAVAAVLGPDPEGHDVAPFRLGAEGALRGALLAAGFERVVEHEMRMTRKVPAGERFWTANLEMGFGVPLAAAGEAKRQAVHAAIEEGFARYREGDVYRLPVHARIGSGSAA